jgi:hypothetical protein
MSTALFGLDDDEPDSASASTGGRGPTIASKPAAIALGFAGLAFAYWAFDQAFERRGHDRPWFVRWLGV